MNREQRRTYEKNLRAKGYSKEDAQNIIALKQKIDSSTSIPEGTKVKFNMKSILEDVNYKTMEQRRKDFIADNENRVFTVEYAERHKVNPSLVQFKEDPLWLWWVGDLEVVK